MVIFHSYVKLPEGKWDNYPLKKNASEGLWIILDP